MGGAARHGAGRGRQGGGEGRAEGEEQQCGRGAVAPDGDQGRPAREVARNYETQGIFFDIILTPDCVCAGTPTSTAR